VIRRCSVQGVTSSSQPLPPVFGAIDSPGFGSVDPSGQGSALAVAEHQGHPHYDPRYVYGYVAPEPNRVSRFLQRIGARMPDWSGPAGVALCFAGGVVYTLAMNPTVSGADSQPTCVLKLLTGFDCPGCGGTRAMWYLLHGNVAAAARNNLPFVFAVPFVIYLYLSWTLQTVSKKKAPPRLRIPNLAFVGFLGAWLVFSILRNLPWAPFTWLYV